MYSGSFLPHASPFENIVCGYALVEQRINPEESIRF